MLLSQLPMQASSLSVKIAYLHPFSFTKTRDFFIVSEISVNKEVMDDVQI